MTIKNLKEIIKEIPDDVTIGYSNSNALPKNILDLIKINSLFEYNKDKNIFIIANFEKNFITSTELEMAKLKIVPEDNEVSEDKLV